MATSFDIVVNPVGSGFAKALQGALRAKVVNSIYRRSSPKVVPAKRTIISRKGNVLQRGADSYVRHHFCVTPQTLNKIKQFIKFKEHNVSSPNFCLRVEDIGLLESKTVFARTLVNSTNGRGIVEFESTCQQPPRAPLYTAYVPKKAEFRIHVFNGQVIDVQEKRKKRGVEERDTRVRNLHNGYVYCRDNIVVPDGCADLAIRAVAACNYQYGAVDIIYNEKRGQCYVLEVNSRPGLMGTTLDKYAEALITTFNLERK